MIELAYLEKYSVAPAPSRDYYGIRILRDEVKLFLWKISHGPHKTPQVRVAKFADFPNDKSLQEEIRRVFGKNALSYVCDLVAGRTKNSEENSASARGWTRVFEEGRAMQRLSKASQPDRKRAVGARARSTGVKVAAGSRQKISSKTPLEVIKTVHPSPKKNIPKSRASDDTSAETPTASRRVIEVSEKITRMKVTRVTDVLKKSREARSGDLTPGRTSSDKSHEKMRNTLAPRKSTILNTDKSLITGSSSVGRRRVDLDQLIREETKKQRERTSSLGVNESYFTCLEGVESSAGDGRKSKEDSSSDNYEIENPWSTNSSIVSVASPKNAARGPAATERSSLTDQYRSARESTVREGSSDVGKKVPENTIERAFAGSSAAKRLDNIDRLATLGRRSANRGSSKTSVNYRGSSKTSIAGQTVEAAAKNRPTSMDENKRSNSNNDIGNRRK